MFEFTARRPVVLVVEDDPHTRSFMESSLDISGFTVIATDSAEAAIAACEEVGLDSVSAVLTDYRLPSGSGIDLLEWVRTRDAAVSAVVITGQGEKSVVEQSLAVGAFRYLEKPVTHQELREVLRNAVEQTRVRRKYADDRRSLQALEHLDQRLSVVVPESLQSRLSVFYRPLHEVGGDFLIIHEHGGGRWLLLVGDVAGHDIRSGYVSTYFQGMFRGCLESGGRVEFALQLFNRSLRQQGLMDLSRPDPVSLSVSAIDIGPQDDFIQNWNYGLAPCVLVSAEGAVIESPFGRFPLGWMEDIQTEPQLICGRGNALLYIFTDGLVEFANSLEINTFSLLYKFLRGLNSVNNLPAEPTDDILATRYLLNPLMPISQTFEPILSEHYAGTEIDHIDHLQTNWRRNVIFALGDSLGDRLYDLLICIREGMINALVHGCERSPDKFAHLQISINSSRNLVRVHIDDPGRGHSFDLKARLAKLASETGKHLGLGIIQHLSDQFQIENKGTSLVFDFEIAPQQDSEEAH